MIKKSHIRLDLYLNENDLRLLRDKRSRKDKDSEENIVTRSFELVMKAKGGCNKSRDTLFLMHTPLMRKKLNEWFKIHPAYFDEYLSNCFIFFPEIIQTFNPNKSDNFVYHMIRNLYNCFVNEYNALKRRKLNIVEYYDESADKYYQDNVHFISVDEELFRIENEE